MLKRLQDFNCIYLYGECAGLNLSVVGLENLLNKSFLIKEIKTVFYYPDPTSGMLQRIDQRLETIAEPAPHYLSLKINDRLLFGHTISEVNFNFDNLDLFIDELKTIACTSNFSSTDGTLFVRIYIYGTSSFDSFEKTKLKMSYDN